MIDIDKLNSQISKELNIDKEIVNDVIHQVFDCTVSIMNDPDDQKDILFNKLFKFKLKKRFKNEDNNSNIQH